MSRYLFVVPPLTGHINPAAAVARELTARGHRVAWAGRAATLAGLGAEVYDAGDPALDAALRDSHERRLGLRGAGALKFLWEEFIVPLARTSRPGVEAAADAFEPDVIVADQQALAGALVARRRGLTWVTSATTSGEFTDPYAAMPKVDDWIRERMAGLCRDAGVAETTDLRFSDDLVLAFTSAALLGSDREFPGHYAFVGPALTARPDHTGFPWSALDPGRRRVLVSLGTVNGDGGARFFDAVVRAAEPLDVQLIVAAPAGLLPDPPPYVLTRPHLPQLDLLSHVDAVVCHAGHNTVCEALAHGLPLVVAPIRDDQPVIAGQVTAAGAGVRVRFARCGPDELRTALVSVLSEPAYRVAAGRVRESFLAAGGAPAAADHLEKIS
ncbi:glycosyltransferase [Actinoplanes sichuanensis]|uniref:Glycosyltransferase n=1 Tax=Actinoplanes sichuanensis TaxID=512349 RepID=A0ABW4AK69_9ACTN|nr:glycosyltransferase [Actinoplanes sichuanensis]BEL03914.1 glycosyltransferase [Actinoplanes sichuanensis]